MDIKEDLEIQLGVLKWIDQNLSTKYQLETENDQWSFRCFDMAIEHHAAIISLSDANLFGSAFALLRVELEALVRGLWIRHAASKKELSRFKEDKSNPTFGKMVEEVEAKIGVESGILSLLKKQQWNIFNSFTHTGIEALIRRVSQRTTGYDNYKKEDVVKGLRISGLIAILTATELAALTKNDEISQKVITLAKEYRDK